MDKIHLILFGIIIVMFIYFQNKTSALEKMTTTPDIRAAVKEVYKADVQAIKNLGDFAATFLSSDKKELNLPFDKVNIDGSLNIKGHDLILNDNIRLVSDADNSYLQTKKNNGFIISKWMTGETLPLRANNITGVNINASGSVGITGNLNANNLSINDSVSLDKLLFRGNATKHQYYITTDANKLYIVPSVNLNGNGGHNWNALTGLYSNGSLDVNGNIIANSMETNQQKVNGNISTTGNVLVGSHTFPGQNTTVPDNIAVITKSGVIYGHALRSKYSIRYGTEISKGRDNINYN